MNTFHDGDVYPVDVRSPPSLHPMVVLGNPNIYIGDVTFES